MLSSGGVSRRILSRLLAGCLSAILAPELHADPDPLIWRFEYTLSGSNVQSVTRSHVGPSFAWGDSIFFYAPQPMKVSTTGTSGNGRFEGRVVARSYSLVLCNPCVPFQGCPPCFGDAKFTGTCAAYVPLATSVNLYPAEYTGTGTVFSCTQIDSAYSSWNNTSVLSRGFPCPDLPVSINESLLFGARDPFETIDYNGTTYVRIGNIPMEAEIRFRLHRVLEAIYVTMDVNANFVITVGGALDAPERVMVLGLEVQNPATHGARFVVSLPEAASASVAVYDIVGRTVVTRDLAGRTGRFEVEANGLATGLYIVRLTHAGRVITRRFATLR